MGIEIPDAVKKLGRLTSKGLVAEFAPEIAKGALVEILKVRKVDVKLASAWVEENTCLWDTFEPREQESLLKLRQYVGKIDWLTVGWFIDAIKGDLPAVASLFLGWTRGANWLARQVAIIKEKTQT